MKSKARQSNFPKIKQLVAEHWYMAYALIMRGATLPILVQLIGKITLATTCLLFSVSEEGEH